MLNVVPAPPPKQVILVRKDLNMRKGKMGAQISHGVMKVFVDAGYIEREEDADGNDFYMLKIPLWSDAYDWLRGKFTKIVLGVDNEVDLLLAYEEAQKAGIPCTLITDAGLTEFHGIPTNTVVTIGPWDSNTIDLITGPQGIVKTTLL